MKKLVVFFGIVLATISLSVRAQEVESTVLMPEISLDTRLGYNHIFSERTGGFAGDGLYLDINGYITPKLSYSLNQRIASSYYEDNSGFNGTNWLTLTYEVGDFAFTAGKDALLVGSFEYDAYDLDSYYEMNSAFYNEFDCWQWGVSAAWYPVENHEVLFQFANSPYSYGASNLFSLAAGWRGAWDWYESYWTVNLWQYDASSVSKAFNTGNRFTFGGLVVDLDLMYRIATSETITIALPEFLPHRISSTSGGVSLRKPDGTAYLMHGSSDADSNISRSKKTRISDCMQPTHITHLPSET